MILHTVNKPPAAGEALSLCLRAVRRGDTVLLIEDGVYAAAYGSELSHQLAALADVTCCALGEDAVLRGLDNRLHPEISTIDYAGFVALAAQADKVQSWF